MIDSSFTFLLLVSGFLASIMVYFIGLQLYKKYSIAILTPNIFAIVLLIILMLTFKIPYEYYQPADKLISYFLKPAIVVLALPLYRRLPKLLEHKLAILTGVTSGIIISSLTIILFARLLDYDSLMTISLLPKSITTPMGIEVSKDLGALVPITVLAILLTGVFGTVIASKVVALGRITHPVAIGVAIGTSAHVLGTTKALEMGETEGAISSLSLAIAGVLSVFYLPLIALLVH